MEDDEDGRRILMREDARREEALAGVPDGDERCEDRREGGVEARSSGSRPALEDVNRRPVGLFPSARRRAPRDHEPAIAEREMREAGVDEDWPSFAFSEDEREYRDTPRYRTRGSVRRAHEDMRRGGDADEARLLLRVSAEDTVSKVDNEHEILPIDIESANLQMILPSLRGFLGFLLGFVLLSTNDSPESDTCVGGI